MRVFKWVALTDASTPQWFPGPFTEPDGFGCFIESPSLASSSLESGCNVLSSPSPKALPSLPKSYPSKHSCRSLCPCPSTAVLSSFCFLVESKCLFTSLKAFLIPPHVLLLSPPSSLVRSVFSSTGWACLCLPSFSIDFPSMGISYLSLQSILPSEPNFSITSHILPFLGVLTCRMCGLRLAHDLKHWWIISKLLLYQYDEFFKDRTSLSSVHMWL